MDLHGNKISHATRLELASIETWTHEESSQASGNLDPGGVVVKVRGVQHSKGEGTGPEDGHINTQQQPSGGGAEQATNDTRASGNKSQTEEANPLNIEWEMIGDDDDNELNKKRGSAIPTNLLPLVGIAIDSANVINDKLMNYP